MLWNLCRSRRFVSLLVAGRSAPPVDGHKREHMMSKDKKKPPAEMDVTSEQNGAGADRPRKLDKSVQAAIGARLRAYYDGVAGEEIPDRFVELMKQLEKKDPGSDKAG